MWVSVFGVFGFSVGGFRLCGGCYWIDVACFLGAMLTLVCCGIVSGFWFGFSGGCFGVFGVFGFCFWMVLLYDRCCWIAHFAFSWGLGLLVGLV